MARFARVIAVNVPHHVTQRGNARQFIFNSDSDRDVYLELLRENIEKHRATLIGYCLMSNHVHPVMVPRRTDALAKSLKHTHGRYAAYWNGKYHSSGHVRQGRFYSCPLDQTHLWQALRYTELNPVRAGLVAEAEAWVWSSAAIHCGVRAAEDWMSMQEWNERWSNSTWREHLKAGASESEIMAVRESTHTGRPLGTEEFVHELEESTKRSLAPRKGGRPVKPDSDARQGELDF